MPHVAAGKYSSPGRYVSHASRTLVCCRGDGMVAGRRRICRTHVVGDGGAGDAASDSCGDAAEVTVLPSPVRAVEGRAAARHGRHRKAARRHAVADRARRQRRRSNRPTGTAAAPYSWFAEVATPGRRHLARTLDAAAGLQPDHPRNRRQRARSRSRVGRRRDGSGRCAIAGTAPPKRCSRPGSKNCSTRRPTRICPGRCGTKCCATSRAISCSTISAAAKTTHNRPRPDCADFVYFLRAYFAYKMGLPFGYSNCSRGAGGSPPKCYQWFDVEHPEVTRPPPPPEQDAAAATRRRAPPPAEPPKTARHLRPLDAAAGGRGRGCRRRSPRPPKPKRADQFRRISARRRRRRSYRRGARLGRDDNTDFYTVPLTREDAAPGHGVCRSLRPCADAGASGAGSRTARPASSSPSTPSPTDRSRASVSGAAISCSCTIPRSAAPASSVSARSWAEKNGPLRRLSNAEIAKNPNYGDFSHEQSQMSAEDFYDRMDDVMSPDPLDPVKAMTDAITSLNEQVKTRVTSIENGRK